MTGVAPAVDRHSGAATKIVLFSSLFRGRDDVYARRFESRTTGKSGYAPACANEWVRGICEKPRIKWAVCPHRRFLPVTDDVIRWHLSGRDDQDQSFVAGVYPLLVDETCCFLAVDFDKAGWRTVGQIPNAPTNPSFPAGFDARPAPYGVSFTSMPCTEGRLIEMAYAFEQATRRRVPPSSTP